MRFLIFRFPTTSSIGWLLVMLLSSFALACKLTSDKGNSAAVFSTEYTFILPFQRAKYVFTPLNLLVCYKWQTGCVYITQQLLELAPPDCSNGSLIQ